MDEIARVEQMVAQGLISADDGERLKEVLRSVQEAEQEGTAPQLAAAGDDRPALPYDASVVSPAGPATLGGPAATPSAPGLSAPIPPVPPLAPTASPAAAATAAPNAAPNAATNATANAAPSGAQASTDRPAPAADAGLPAGTKWVRVELVAGDLDVGVDPQLTEPRAESDTGEAALERTDYGYRVSIGRGEGSFLRGLEGPLAGLLISKGRPGDLKLTLPAGYGVDLAMTTGDVDLDGVPFLRGTLSAGDLDAHGLEGINFSSMAGDVSVSLRPTSGRHRIVNTAGELKVTLLPGSDVAVHGDVSIGEAKAGPEFQTGRRMMSGTVSGAIGAGTARLDLKVTAGSIKLRTGTDDRG
ncbi:MAG TPA: hypothetical protein PKN52_05635 [Trueperaceae bacterium]|nr:hypothetical protein [Trueperaceae bacterium]